MLCYIKDSKISKWSVCVMQNFHCLPTAQSSCFNYAKRITRQKASSVWNRHENFGMWQDDTRSSNLLNNARSSETVERVIEPNFRGRKLFGLIWIARYVEFCRVTAYNALVWYRLLWRTFRLSRQKRRNEKQSFLKKKKKKKPTRCNNNNFINNFN